MASYVVMQPSRPASGEDAVIVRDGFHVLAFLVPVVWLLFHRMWIEAAVALAATLMLAALGSLSGMSNAVPALSLLVSIYVGLEGSALRLAALRRRGWHDAGIFEADGHADAETRFLAEAPEPEPAVDGPWQKSSDQKHHTTARQRGSMDLLGTAGSR